VKLKSDITAKPSRRRWAIGLISGSLALAAMSLTGPDLAAASTGPLDPSFGEGGIALTHGPEGQAALGLTEDGRGRLIAVGVSDFEDFVVRRYRANGAPDPSFGAYGGEARSPFGGGGMELAARAAAIQPDGKIVVAGGTESAFALGRYDGSGRVDRHFGRHGRVLTAAGLGGASALDVAVQPNGRILAAGYGIDFGHRRRWTAMLVGYRPNGHIDRGFAKAGMFRIQARRRSGTFSGVEVLPSGKILLAGDLRGRLLLVRLLANGRPDRSFGGGDGRVLLDADGDPDCPCSHANALAIGPGGKPLLAGHDSKLSSNSGLLVRFLPNGRPDPSFGEGGIVRTHVPRTSLVDNAVAVQRNGRIVTAGFFERRRTGGIQTAVLRYLPDGRPDPSFGRSGFFPLHRGLLSVAHAALAQPDGRVVVAGGATFRAPEASPESESLLIGAQFMLMRFLGG
jgi:uncharacterized delta-60 repeat protein